MNIGFGQLLIVIFICFLLFGNVTNLILNIKSFLDNLRKPN